MDNIYIGSTAERPSIFDCRLSRDAFPVAANTKDELISNRQRIARIVTDVFTYGHYHGQYIDKHCTPVRISH